jgi:hypothetical protein
VTAAALSWHDLHELSFVGSTALANELMQLGKRFASGVIVTQVVPALEGHSSLVLDYIKVWGTQIDENGRYQSIDLQ